MAPGTELEAVADLLDGRVDLGHRGVVLDLLLNKVDHELASGAGKGILLLLFSRSEGEKGAEGNDDSDLHGDEERRASDRDLRF